ncbi:helix-turn-helix domain-containing protein [Caulobacter sp. LARHSG274]
MPEAAFWFVYQGSAAWSAQTLPHPSPDPVDLHVGARVRLRRKMVGVSQSQLGQALGLTFQQLQKYERGTNRISASKLHALAHHLKTPIAWFFEGLPDPAQPAAEDDRRASDQQAFLAIREGVALAAVFPRLPVRQRRKLLGLMQSLTEPDGLTNAV